jgi:hypothetical protein
VRDNDIVPVELDTLDRRPLDPQQSPPYLAPRTPFSVHQFQTLDKSGT